jgi:hypothetical protein
MWNELNGCNKSKAKTIARSQLNGAKEEKEKNGNVLKLAIMHHLYQLNQ